MPSPWHVLLLLALAAVVRLAIILPPCRRRRRTALQQPAAPTAATAAVVWGSGGHTAEMCGLLRLLATAADGGNAPRLRINLHLKAVTDVMTAGRVATSGVLAGEPTYVDMPRPREVGGSFIGAVLPTLAAAATAAAHLARHRPALLLMNGPGTCVPVVLAALALRFAGICDPALVFVESACRVQRLSLTGKLLRPLVDVLAVQWPALAAALPDAVYVGLLM